MRQDWPITRDLVLIGGGHAHALVLRRWGMAPQAGARVTLLDPAPVTPYTGMLPGLIAGHYTRPEMMIDLLRLARFAGARLIEGRAAGIDRAAGRVLLEGGRSLRYDVASLDIGIGSGLPDLPGFPEHGLAAKPLGRFAEGWEAFVRIAPPDPHVTVIGAGVGGVELAMAMAFRLRGLGRQARVTVLDRDAALSGVGQGARAALMAQMAAQGVVLMAGAQPVEVRADEIVLADGRTLRSDLTLSVAGARPQGWLGATGLALTDGFVTVGPTLQSSDPAIFAVGDCAHMEHAPRPKAGVFAVRQAPVLHYNLRAALSDRPMRRFAPQKDYLKLVSTGGKAAVADRFGLRLEGRWLWRWKDRIDRTFMAKFGDYPAMAAAALPPDAAAGLREALGEKPMCGGCGAKVGPGALARALDGLAPPARAEVLSGPGDDAAVLRVAGGVQVLSTDHLRAFTADPSLMARIAAIHALGDVHAMGARPQVALAQIVLPRADEVIQADMLAEIMAAAETVFRAHGADVVGGHTSVGAELTVGFTVTGLADWVIAKGGALPGDVLILTKPLGTGVLLAAGMAGRAVPGVLLGEAVSACFASMQRSLAPAAAVLAPVAHAMTDVTGFGLAGHLLEICTASGVAARLRLADVPMLAGAVAASAAGYASTLAPANRAACAGRMTGAEGAAAALLFDPQTAGGLLAAVPAAEADAVLAVLGGTAAAIGVVEAGWPALVVEG